LALSAADILGDKDDDWLVAVETTGSVTPNPKELDAVTIATVSSVTKTVTHTDPTVIVQMSR
jgi:hypothetical protein